MLSPPEDRDLRARFTNLRREDRSAAPPFQPTAPAKTRGSFVRIALAAVALLAIAVLWVWRTRRATDASPRELAAWSSPTAFLLETPGQQLLHQTPRLGEPLIYALPAAQDGPQ